MIWKEKYNLGNILIDNQHKELFYRVTTFIENLRSKMAWDEKVEQVNETLDFMKIYVVNHFCDEEAYQRKVGYPQLNEHCKIHREMVEYVVAISEQYEKEGYKEELLQQFGGKLLAWLINHVVAEDQKIAEYVRRKEKSI